MGKGSKNILYVLYYRNSTGMSRSKVGMGVRIE